MRKIQRDNKQAVNWHGILTICGSVQSSLKIRTRRSKIVSRAVATSGATSVDRLRCAAVLKVGVLSRC